MASKGLKSLACPPGLGDHIDCPTSGPSNYAIIQLVCKQIHKELDSAGTLFSHSALQFADLDVAYQYLFGLREDDRAAITHLRLSIPYSLTSALPGSNYDIYHGPEMADNWQAICNYFSSPWDRKTVRNVKLIGFHLLLRRDD
jgi:hypothetical protein